MINYLSVEKKKNETEGTKISEKDAPQLYGAVGIAAMLGLNVIFTSRGWPRVAFLAQNLTYLIIVATIVAVDYVN